MNTQTGILKNLVAIVKPASAIVAAVANLAAIVNFVLGQPFISGIFFVVGGIIGVIVPVLFDTLPRWARLLLALIFLVVFGVGMWLIFRDTPPKQVVLLPRTSVGLSPARFGCPIQGSEGTITRGGVLALTGLNPSQAYHLTLNGYPGRPPNDELMKINRVGDEGYWDFMKVNTDSNGNARNVKLEAALPPGVTLRPEESYIAKFFVKEDTAYCIVLSYDNFLFTVK